AMPFANSLTITHSDFSNYVHCDRDAIAVAYGWWWVGYKGHSKDSWKLSLDGSFDHNQVTGGSFLIAQHGIAIDFSRAEGLVEIYWRGKNDHHVTLASNSPENVTRFGTSVQITQSGVGGMNAWRKSGYDPERTTSRDDRLAYLSKKLETKMDKLH
ncbi:hypothetical protein EV359DRAFT_48145, partial [Lentinula novae-zelandiae]